jgi:hypothetical protein
VCGGGGHFPKSNPISKLLGSGLLGKNYYYYRRHAKGHSPDFSKQGNPWGILHDILNPGVAQGRANSILKGRIVLAFLVF